MVLKRLTRLYLILGKTFNVWIAPIFAGIFIAFLRIFIGFGRVLDNIFFAIKKKTIQNPIIIVGNPRSGTTFLHRFLIQQGIGGVSELWQMIYPSIIVQKCLKPFLPLLEKISPAK